jgi:uncharacterized protein (TIGR02594 family)
MAVPQWLQVALLEIGQQELDGSRHNPRIVLYHSATSLKATDDETPWCASFVGWCLLQAGIKGTGSAAARSYLAFGKAVGDRPALGDIAVFQRGANPAQGHVGFVLDCYGGIITLLNGNVQNRVCVSTFGVSRLLGYRRP